MFTVIDHSVSVWYLDNDGTLRMQIFHSCCFLIEFFPIRKLARASSQIDHDVVHICFKGLESIYLGVIVQFGDFKIYQRVPSSKKNISICSSCLDNGSEIN